jgi:prepilin-type N-terminal cleavage/methylation domain-containing protein
MNKRTGFSIIELIVVIAVIGLLIALLLPAIQSSRSSTRRVSCLSNLRQIGLAFQNYHDLFNLLPPFSVWSTASTGEPLGGNTWPVGFIDRVAIGLAPGSEPSRLHTNWAVILLPHLEQGNLYNQYSSHLPVSDSANAQVRMAELPIFKCPEDTYNGSSNQYQRDYLSGTSDNLYARGNYAMNFGPARACVHGKDSGCEEGFHVDDTDLINKVTTMWANGIGGVNYSFSFTDVSAGQSNVVAIDEVRAGVHAVDPRGTWALGFSGASGTARHGLLEFPNNDGGGPNNSLADSDDIVGCTQLEMEVGQEFLSQTNMPCLAKSNETNNQATSRSMHPNGVHVMMVDGSAHFISDTVDIDVWYNIHRRDTPESVTLPF